MRMSNYLTTTLLLSLILCLFSDASAGGFKLRRQTFSAGKTEATSASFQSTGVAGEIIPEQGVSDNFIATTEFIPEGVVRCCGGPTVGNVDCEGIIDIGDVTVMIQNLFITLNDPCCEDEADIDRTGLVDIGDLTILIGSLFITLNPLGPCP